MIALPVVLGVLLFGWVLFGGAEDEERFSIRRPRDALIVIVAGTLLIVGFIGLIGIRLR